MFCPKCGTKNIDDAKFCVACGSQIQEPERAESQEESVVNTNTTLNQPAIETSSATPVKTKMSGSAIAGFVLSLVGIFFAAIICGTLGLIFSAMGMKASSSNNTIKGKGLAVAGLVISIIDVVFALIYLGM